MTDIDWNMRIKYFEIDNIIYSLSKKIYGMEIEYNELQLLIEMKYANEWKKLKI